MKLPYNVLRNAPCHVSRTVLCAIGLSSVSLLAHADPTLYIGMNGGTLEKSYSGHVFPDFEKANHVKIVVVPGTSSDIMAKMQAQKAAPTMNLAFLDDGVMVRAISLGLCQKVADAPVLKDVIPAARFPDDQALGIQLGVEAVNRYESHLINSAEQAVALVERVGMDNVFVHLDTFHMNMEEKGAANGILVARNHLRYMHMSESDRGTPGEGNVPWDSIFTALSAIGFKGALTLESFVSMPVEMAGDISTWRPVARSAEEVLDRGVAFLRNKAEQYALI